MLGFLEDIIPFNKSDASKDMLFAHEQIDSVNDVFDYSESPETGDDKVASVDAPSSDDVVPTSSDDQNTSPVPNDEPRRSARPTRAPSWQKDYVMFGNSVAYSIEKQICYYSIHLNYKNYIYVAKKKL